MSERSEQNINLSLNIEGFGSISEALQACFEVETLAEDNAYLCSSCNEKLAAQRSQLILSPPRYLILALNRFAYDAGAQERRKISTHCTVPLALDLTAYAKEAGADYLLQGVVLHAGMPDAGHYTSIRRDGEKWLLCDDASIREINEEEVLRTAAGPQEASQSAASAYLLIYKNTNQVEEKAIKDSDLIARLRNDQQARNHNYWKKLRLFSPELCEFMTLLAGQAPSFTPLRYFYTVGVRLDSVPIPLVKTLFQLLSKQPELANWSLRVFSHPQMLNELILQCPLPLKRKILLAFAVQSYAYGSPRAKETLINCLAAIRARLPDFPTSDQEGFYELIYRLAASETNPQVKQQLILMAIGPMLGLERSRPNYPAADAQTYLGHPILEAAPVFSATSTIPALSYISALCRLGVTFGMEDINRALQSEDFLRRLVRGSNTRLGANSIAAALHVLTQASSEELSPTYFRILQEQVQDCRTESFPYALLQIKRLIYYMSKDATKNILSELEPRFSDHLTRYILPGECLVRFFYRLGVILPSVNDWLLEHPDFFALLTSWHAKYLQCNADNLQGFSLAPDRPFAQAFTPNPTVSALAAAILEQNFPEVHIDSDDEAGSIEIGEEVNFRYSDEKFYKIDVKLNLGAVLVLQFPGYGEFLKEGDSEDLKPLS